MVDELTTSGMFGVPIKSVGYIPDSKESIRISGVTHYQVEKVGYAFDGWFTTPSDANQYEESKKAVTGDTIYWSDIDTATLYARWSPVEYTLTYNTNLPSGVNNASVMWDRTIASAQNKFKFGDNYGKDVLPIPKINGYTFKGWFISPTDGSSKNIYRDEWNFGTTDWALLTANNMKITVYAQWEVKEINVTWDGNVGSGSTIPKVDNKNQTTVTEKYKYSDVIRSLKNATRDGYKLNGWYLKKGEDVLSETYNRNAWANKVVANSTRTTFDEDTSIYAKWMPNEITINFNANEGSSSNKANLSYTQRKILFDDLINKSRSSRSIDSELPTSTITGGLPIATLDGYEFVSWNTKADGTGKTYTATDKFTEFSNNNIVTLYAQWRAKDYTVSFNLNDASNSHGSTNANPTSYANITLTYDSHFADLYTPTRTGYTFDGWYMKDGFNGGNIENGTWGTKVVNGLRFNGSQIVEIKDNASDITLYAKWLRKEIRVVYNANKGSGTAEVTFIDGLNKITGDTYNGIGYFDLELSKNRNLTDRQLVTATGNGYIFKGFSTSTSDSDIKDLSTWDVNSEDEIVLYAIWEAKQYKIVFDGNYTNEMKPQGSGPHSTDVDTVNLPTQVINVTFENNFPDLSSARASIYSNNTTLGISNAEGWTFSGWSYNKTDIITNTTNFDGTAYSSSKVDESKSEITLYAMWTEKTYNINFSGNLTAATVTPDTLPSITGVKFNELRTIDTSTYKFESDGYDFVGWSTKADSLTPEYNTKVSGAVVSPQVTRLKDGGDVTLYAIWSVAGYNITYKNRSDMSTHKTNMNMVENKFLPSWYNILGQTEGNKTITRPSRSGYRFLYWELPSGATQSEITITAGNFIDNVRGDIEIIAVWEPNAYRVTFNGNGGVGAGGETNYEASLVTDEAYVIPAWDFTKKNHIISYWNTQPNGSGRSFTVRQSITINTFYANIADYEPITLYAIWATTTSGRQVTPRGGSSGGGGGGGGGGGSTAIAGTQGVGFNATTLDPLGGLGNTANAVNAAGGGGMTGNDGLTYDGTGASYGNWNYNPTTNKWTYTITSGDSVGFGGNQVNSIGNVATNGWYKIPAGNGWFGWYSFDSSGNMRTGFYTENGNTYYLDERQGVTTGRRETGWVTVGGREYFFSPVTGALQTNTVTPDGYIVDATGAKVGVANTEQKISAGVNVANYKGKPVEGMWNYDNSTNSWNLSLNNVDSNQSYIASNEWVNIMYNGQRQSYHFNAYGIMEVGLITDVDGNTYYLDETNSRGRGALKTGIVTLGGIEYYFSEENSLALPYGALVKNGTLPDGRRTDSTGRIIKQ